MKEFPCKIGATVRDYDREKIPKAYRSQMSRVIELGLVAVQEALDDAKWDGDRENTVFSLYLLT